MFPDDRNSMARGRFYGFSIGLDVVSLHLPAHQPHIARIQGKRKETDIRRDGDAIGTIAGGNLIVMPRRKSETASPVATRASHARGPCRNEYGAGRGKTASC